MLFLIPLPTYIYTSSIDKKSTLDSNNDSSFS